MSFQLRASLLPRLNSKSRALRAVSTTSGKQPVVTVTGASGFIGSHIVSLLLKIPGIKVRATVYDIENKQDYGFLSHLPRHPSNPPVEIFEADLLTWGAFREPLDGADFLVHTAAPFLLQTEDPYHDIHEPIVVGAMNVLEEAVKTPGLKRVVYTSACAAVRGERPSGHLYTEEDWNDTADERRDPFYHAKTKSEMEAWQMMKGKGRPELVTILPSLTLGPVLSPNISTKSIEFVRGFLRGDFKKTGAPPLHFASVDVRDVARMHVLALETAKVPPARYLVTSDVSMTLLELSQLLRPEYNHLPLPEHLEEDVPVRHHFGMRRSLTFLGSLIPTKQTVLDTASSLFKHGVVNQVSRSAWMEINAAPQFLCST